MGYDFEVSQKVLSAFNISLEQYLNLDKDTKTLLEKAYWEALKEKDNQKTNKVKTKVLRIFKGK